MFSNIGDELQVGLALCVFSPGKSWLLLVDDFLEWTDWKLLQLIKKNMNLKKYLVVLVHICQHSNPKCSPVQ